MVRGGELHDVSPPVVPRSRQPPCPEGQFAEHLKGSGQPINTIPHAALLQRPDNRQKWCIHFVCIMFSFFLKYTEMETPRLFVWFFFLHLLACGTPTGHITNRWIG